MLRVMPKRLGDIRRANALTREELHERSGVSTRQIARIEGEEEPVDCRPRTVERLARALQVDVGVLVGEVAVPLGHSGRGAAGARVDAGRLKALRQRRGLSQEGLAAAARVSKSQIQRIERDEAGSVRRHTLASLSRALRVDADVLTGRASLDDADGAAGTAVQMGARVSTETRLAYDLLARRYGIGAKHLIELAPLLFALLAESSLAARREKLAAATEVRDALEGMASEDPMLYFAKYLVDVDAGIAAEGLSIAAADVLGRRIWQGDDLGRFDEDDLNVTPFEDHLREFADRLGVPGVVRIEEFPLLMTDLWGVSSYRVCGDFLDDVAGGSDGSRLALECGDVRLSEIPDELTASEATALRVEWLEARLGENGRRLQRAARRWEKLLETFELEVGDAEGGRG